MNNIVILPIIIPFIIGAILILFAKPTEFKES